MAHPHQDDARKFHGNKLQKLTGERGEYPPDRASRIAGTPNSASAQGDAARAPEEEWAGTKSRQVSNLGNVRK